MKYLIANWKAEMIWKDVNSWLNEFRDLMNGKNAVHNALQEETLSIIVCPPFPFIPFVKAALDEFNIETGAQTVSSIDNGKYTGEVTAQALAHYVKYAIIGHSERRKYVQETDEDIQKKYIHCNKNAITSILCVRNESDTIFSNAKIVAYEPVGAIGNGKNENPQAVIEMKKKLHLTGNTSFIYGGSVDEQNVKEYLSTEEIHGFLVGTASLHATEFFMLASKMID